MEKDNLITRKMEPIEPDMRKPRIRLNKKS